MLLSSAVDSGAKLRPTPEERKKFRLGPEFEEYWNEVFETAPDKPVFFGGSLTAYVTP